MIHQIQGLETIEDYYNKLKRELDRLEVAEIEYCQNDAIDHALNAISTAWHLAEWVASFMSVDKETVREKIAERCSQYNDFHDITTGVKHFTVSRPRSEEVEVQEIITSAQAVYTTEQRQAIKYQIDYPDSEPTYIRSEPWPIVVKLNDEYARNVIRHVMNIWKEYLKEQGIEV